MEQEIIIQLGSESDAVYNSTTDEIIFAGIGSYMARSFIPTSNWIINRLALSHAAITNRANFTYLVGIGTWDNSIGRPATVAGAGRTLQYTNYCEAGSSKTLNAIQIYPISDTQLTAGNRYFMGFGITSTTGTFSITTKPQMGSWPLTPTSLSGVYSHAGFNTGVIRGEWSTFNYGYDSGNGQTIWYNRFFHLGALATTAVGVLRHFGTNYQAGFTLYFNTDFQSIYLDSIQVEISNSLNAARLFPTGHGITHFITLYDSDGATALTEHRISHYTSPSLSNYEKVHFPIKYYLQNKKLYHVGIGASDPNDNGATGVNLMAGVVLPYDFQSGNAITSINFQKSSKAGAPQYFTHNVTVAALRLDLLKGSRQGGIGNV